MELVCHYEIDNRSFLICWDEADRLYVAQDEFKQSVGYSSDVGDLIQAIGELVLKHVPEELN